MADEAESKAPSETIFICLVRIPNFLLLCSHAVHGLK